MMSQLNYQIITLCRAYAAILFTRHSLVGLLFILATFIYPNAGISGLIGAISGLTTATLLRFPNLKTGLYIYNSLLTGLSLGIVYKFDQHLLILIVAGAAIAVFLTVAISDFFWRLGQLPALSIPFILSALIVAFAARSYGTLSSYLTPQIPLDIYFSLGIDRFLSALGTVFFTTHPLAGLMLLMGLLITSRYLTLLAICGYIAGHSFYLYISGSTHPGMDTFTSFNYMLSAMAVGGIFTIPSRSGFVLAMVAAIITALVTSATQSLMLLYNLPVMAIPFLATTMVILLALSKRVQNEYPILTLANPQLPEISAEDQRLYRSRSKYNDSTPILLPVIGKWNIYQGFNGKHTHQAPWQHALDFYIEHDGKSYRNEGAHVTDYYCFDLPVVSPVYGQVIKTVNHIADNVIGQVNTTENWGNHILIQLQNGRYLLLAHLRQNSVVVENGAWINPGDRLGSCGNSGRSPQPHLHCQLQKSALLGSETVPFHLSSIIISHKKQPRFMFASRPKEGDQISTALGQSNIKTALDFSVGKQLFYEIDDHKSKQEIGFYVDIDLLGKLTLNAENGASVQFSHDYGVLSFYKRNHIPNIYLDALVLAISSTPLGQGTLSWTDAPSYRLSQSSQKALFYGFLFPLGKGYESRYRRMVLEKDQQWKQNGEHKLSFSGLNLDKRKTEVIYSVNSGIEYFSLKSDSIMIKASLKAVGQKSDQGIPGWKHESY